MLRRLPRRRMARTSFRSRLTSLSLTSMPEALRPASRLGRSKSAESSTADAERAVNAVSPVLVGAPDAAASMMSVARASVASGPEAAVALDVVSDELPAGGVVLKYDAPSCRSMKLRPLYEVGSGTL